MQVKKVIGHCTCPVCGHPDAQVKEDKNGHAFIFCGDCAAQTFTRNDYRDKRLRERMRPVTVTVTEPEKPPVTVQTEPTITAPAKKPASTVPDTVTEPTKPKPKQSSSWFTPILAGGE